MSAEAIVAAVSAVVGTGITLAVIIGRGVWHVSKIDSNLGTVCQRMEEHATECDDHRSHLDRQVINHEARIRNLES